MFNDNVDWTRARRAEEYASQNPLKMPKDWPTDINEAGAYNLDYAKYINAVKKRDAARLADLEKRKAAIIEQSDKSKLEQMRLDALNRLKR